MENEVEQSVLKDNYTAAEEYLEMERASQEKHELHNGTLIAMPEVSLNHKRIVRNLTVGIGTYLQGKSYGLFPGDLKIKVLTKDSFTYPDISIVCGEPELMDDHFDTLLNPSVIIEVSGPSTEKYDKGFKLVHYLQLPSLKEYIMISSTGMYIYHSHRQIDGSWKFTEITDPATSLFINTIAYTITVDDIYDDVKL